MNFDDWNRGTPPKDGKKYLAARISEGLGVHPEGYVFDMPEETWFDGVGFVTSNQFAGGTRAFVPAPNRWRELDNPTSQELSAAYELYFHELKQFSDADFIRLKWESSAHIRALLVERVRVVINALKNCDQGERK